MRAINGGKAQITKRPAAQIPEAPPGILRRACQWIMKRPAERIPLPIGVGIYGTGGVLSMFEAPGLGVGAVSLATAFAAYAVTRSRTNDETGAAKLGTAVGMSGVWMGTASELGLTMPVTGAYWVLFAVSYGIYRLDDTTRRSVRSRKQKTQWHILANRFGLAGSHLLSHSETRLGERYVVDVIGTGKRASTLASKDLEERIAEQLKLSADQVKTRAKYIAGRLEININRRDPWAEDVLHPVLTPGHEISLPEVADVRKPLIIGQKPETGDPLELVVWDDDGAAHISVVGIKGGGKTVFLNDVIERLTAADNVTVWGIAVSKYKDLQRWRDAGSLGLSALGPDEQLRAIEILNLAVKTIDYRAANNPDAVFQPSHGHPMIEIVIDEIDALVTGKYGKAAVKALTYITSKGRSESVGVIIIGQRGTAQWMGGANIRANLDRFVLLKVSRPNEIANAVGSVLAATLPDVNKYGKGKAGVVCIANVSGDHSQGRTFYLRDFDDIVHVATSRVPSPLEPGLVEHLGDAYDKLRGVAVAPQPALDHLDRELEASVPSDLQDEWSANMKGRIKKAKEDLANIPDVPELSPEMAEVMAQAAMERRQQAADNTVITPDYQERLIELLGAPGGARISQVIELLGGSRTGAWNVLNKLRVEGVAESTGRGSAARWVLKPGGREAMEAMGGDAGKPSASHSE